MHPIAQELNRALEHTVIARLFSRFGTRCFFPRGIASQAAEARELAGTYDATVGMAYAEGRPMMLPSMRRLVPELSTEEAVSYASTGGEKELRSLWKRHMAAKNPHLEPDRVSEPMVVAGLTNGIAHVLDLFLNDGDDVVLPDLYWGNYQLMAETRHAARLHPFPFFNGAGGLNVAALEEGLTRHGAGGKVVLILNFPNNPTGYAPTESEAAAVTEAVSRVAESGTDVLAIMDDAYFGLFYEPGTYRESLFVPLSRIHERVLAVKVDGATKEEYAWGLRIGFVTFGSAGATPEHYQALNQKLMGAVRSSISNSSRPAQTLLMRGLSSPDHEAEKRELYEQLRRRYQTVKRLVEARRGDSVLEALPFNAGYFLTFRVHQGSAEALRRELLHGQGIGTISLQDRYLRVAYAVVEPEDLEPLFAQIYETAHRLCAG